MTSHDFALRSCSKNFHPRAASSSSKDRRWWSASRAPSRTCIGAARWTASRFAAPTHSGRVVAFDNFVGLFTSKAYAEEAQHIPVLRAKLREVLESEGAAPGSHDYKEIVSAFNSFPKDELFRAPVAELRAQLRLILDVKSEAAVRLFVAPDLRHGNVIALVVMPREAGSAELSRRIQDTLAAALHGTLVYFYLALGEGYTARLHFCFFADPPKASVIRGLETAIAELARRWDDRLQERLLEKFGPKRGRALAERWAGCVQRRLPGCD